MKTITDIRVQTLIRYVSKVWIHKVDSTYGRDDLRGIYHWLVTTNPSIFQIYQDIPTWSSIVIGIQIYGAEDGDGRGSAHLRSILAEFEKYEESTNEVDEDEGYVLCM